jgi:hypothetical protein
VAARVSINLIVEVLDRAPETLTSGERLVLVVIAEWANDNTREARQTHGWNLETICRRAGIKRSGLKSVLQGLAKKGLEVRVPVKVKDGKPVYAYEGTALTFRVPLMPERGGHSIPSDGSRGVATASERGGCGISEGRPQPPPSPQGSPLKKNPSSLSRTEAAADPVAAVAAQRIERENEVGSQSLNPIHKMLTAAGAPADHLDEIQEEITARHEPRSNAWWRTVAENGDLPDLVGEVLEALAPMPATVDQQRDAHPFEPKDDGSPDCKRCPFPEANGRHRIGNQGGGYLSAKSGIDRNEQRTIRSPADQRIADGVELYNKYRRLEESA